MTEQNKDDEVGKVDIDCTNMDAANWAKAFCEKFPGHDEGLMLAWFASAIMCGWDNAHWEIKESNPHPDSNELMELRRDAERYRWIRNNAGFNLDNDYNIGNFQVSQKIKNGEAWYYYEEKLDEIIDAALAQAAVAAAMRKCAELVRTQVVWNESVAPDCFAEAILASIPAEANAALEKICTEVAEKCFALGYATHGYFDGDAAGDDLRAIVASVIEKGK